MPTPRCHPIGGGRTKTANEYSRIARLHILPQLGEMKVKDVRPQHVLAALEKAAQKRDPKRVGGGVIANRTRDLLACLFNFAVKKLITEWNQNPMTPVHRQVEEHARTRALSETELRAFFLALEASVISRPVRLP